MQQSGLSGFIPSSGCQSVEPNLHMHKAAIIDMVTCRGKVGIVVTVSHCVVKQLAGHLHHEKQAHQRLASKLMFIFIWKAQAMQKLD